MINSQVSRLFTPPRPSVPIPHPPIKRRHLGTRFPPPSDRQTHRQPAPRVNSRSGPIEREAERRGTLYRTESHLSRVLQDALTSHLGLSNSSVSVTDESAQTCTCMCTPLSEALVMIGSALHILCIMYKVFNGSNMGCVRRISE